MKTVIKYLKPFTAGLILSIAFLFAQTIADLALPTLMGNIISTGLQQGGLQSSSPEVLSADNMRLAEALMTPEEKQAANSIYQAASKDGASASGKPYAEAYPGIEGEFFVKEGESRESDLAFGNSFYTLMHYARTVAGNSQNAGADFPDIADYRVFSPALESMPEAEKGLLRQEALADIPEATVLQSAVAISRSIIAEAGVDTLGLQRSYILRIGLSMLAIAVLSGACTALLGYFSAKVSAGFGRNLRKALFEKIEGFSAKEFDHFSTASLITRCTNDVQSVQMLMGMGIRMLFSAPIMGIGGVVLAVRTSLSMSWIIALAVLVQLCLVTLITSVAFPKFSLVQKLTDRITLVARENLSGLMVVRAFNTQSSEKSRFAGANEDLLRTELFINRIMAFMMPVMTLVMNGLSLLIIWVGARQIAASRIQIGDMMAFTQYAMMILMSFMGISMMFQMLPRTMISVRRINEVLSTELTITDPPSPKPFSEGERGLVEFANVSFRYSDASNDALSEISFVAKPGETTAIIGSTGSGKSTVASLLLRFYDVTEGSVKVGGRDVRDVTQRDLREKIGYIPQKAVLLSGTIDSNLRYGMQEAEPDLIEWAAEIAQARGFITSKEEGYDQQISQGGANVSGGQKQRLSIARALVKKPDILIFDDSFSALDFKTDNALRAALKEQIGASTVILVAQRVSTIMHAEQIIVLDHGTIVGKGTHEELLKTCKEYYEIASSQFSEKELSA
ncbi:MAG: ABC transporter ATP-binding protein/permease [Eubacteriaceae bacterium]|jgi:ATP-binding cassette subfamily B protein|nr:ABC transporter ATP-binding protein/permease [Eubacteriaceae bacterium]